MATRSTTALNTQKNTGTTGSTVSAAAARAASNYAVNWRYVLKIATSGTPQPAPAYRVPAGATVRAKAGANSAVIYIAKDRDTLNNGLSQPISALDEIVFPVENTAHIWVQGFAGDTITLMVTTAPVTGS